ncbi:glycosyltransferase family 1 protein [soil metagenome]
MAGCSLLVDARGLFASGIGRYLREILAVVFQDRRFTDVTLLGEPHALGKFASESEARDALRIRVREYPLGFYTLSSQVAWIRMWSRGEVNADVAFFPHYDAPCFGLPSRSVVTVHDLTHFRLPEKFPLRLRAAAAILLRRGAGRASRVIVVSECSRRDLVTRLPRAAERAEVIANGVSAFFSVAPGVDSTADLPAGVRMPYLLCVGNRKPHKNLVAAVETLARLAPEDPELRLVVAGRVFAGWDDVLKLAARKGIADRIDSLPTPSDSELRALYANAEVLLFPSRYEGFGLPILEAMAAGSPVVASNRASIPDVAGGAAILLDPGDHDGMAAAVRRVRGEPQTRRELVRRGRCRAAELTWSRAGRRTADLLYEVASAPR